LTTPHPFRPTRRRSSRLIPSTNLLIRWRRDVINRKLSLRTLSHHSLFLMFRERSYRDNVTIFNISIIPIVQFEEKKFLETAKKIIQGSVANASAKLENDQAAGKK
jgi:hypothetical protein